MVQRPQDKVKEFSWGTQKGHPKEYRRNLQGRVYIVCLVVWGLLAVGFAAKCLAVARDSHYRIPVIVTQSAFGFITY